MKSNRIYLDTNIYFSPFDDQRQERIQRETDAIIALFGLLMSGKIAAVSSDILYYEVHLTKDTVKKSKVNSLLSLCGERAEQTDMVKTWSALLSKETGLSARDAIHLISAIFSKSGYYLTCDRELIRKEKRINTFLMKNSLGHITIINPIHFIET